MSDELIVLGIETSCDDTSLCLLKGIPGEAKPEILSHRSFGQNEILSEWGGVVPEIAARNHLLKITPLLKETFKEAKLTAKELDLIGVTTNPGLLGPLLTGVNAAKTLSLLHQLPIISVNHLFAHLEAIFLSVDISYPYLGVLVSGGHTLFLKASSATDFKVIGRTIDDAIGEAFDKGGKMLGLDYPAGREIDELSKLGNDQKYSFPIGLKHSGDTKMSFSGVKTSLRTHLEKNGLPQKGSQDFYDLVASYQGKLVEAIRLKLKKCLELHFPDEQDIPIVLGGGVACNSKLRSVLKDNFPKIHLVEPKFCTDNGAMIAGHALRTTHLKIPFPECLKLDAKNRYIKKSK